MSRPLRPGVWFLETHTSRMFAYPVGEAHGGSALTTVLRRDRRTGPLASRASGTILGLLLVATRPGIAGRRLGRYPYGGSARTMQHIAPSICLLAGLGAARLIGTDRAARSPADACSAAPGRSWRASD